MSNHRSERSSDHCRNRDFLAVDKALIEVGVTNEERIRIYKILAAILHIGNVTFEENPVIAGCQIADSSNHSSYAAQLLGIEPRTLEDSLLTRKIYVTGSDPIM